MIMKKSFYELIKTEDGLMCGINRYEDAINIYTDEKKRIIEREIDNLSDSEYLNDMARYDRMINEAKTRKDEYEVELKNIRLQIRDYIKNVYMIN